MKKVFYVFVVLSFAMFLSACSTFLTGPQGPDSGEEIDLGPDSGEEVDTSEPQGPDSGEEIDTSSESNSPDSGEEEIVEEPTSPDSGEEIDTSEDDNDDDEGDAPTSPDSGEEIDTTDPDKAEADEEIDDELSSGYGSCDSINDSSICVTYSGSYWKVANNMKLHCQNAGTFSTKPCPSDMLGGCKVGAGTANENIIWNYGRGGDPFTEVIGYSAMSCTAIPGSAWIGR
ncbi:MAG: hypothetical protein WC415_05585 [Patescibacteria group bacterium]|jgi:hypothetical protein